MSLSFIEDNESITFVLENLTTRFKLRLSEWENNFIKSIKYQWERDNKLSKKQLQTLSNIWEKV